MHRLLRSLPLVFLAVVLGVSTGVAQPSSSSGTIGVQADGAVGQEETAASEAATDRSDRTTEALSRAEIRRVMLGGVERGSGAATGVRLTGSEPLQQEASNNRTVYYIIGGALVAGGLVAGILALDDGDGGGGGGGGTQNIPPPPGRP